MPTNDKPLTSLQMLQKMSSQLGQGLKVGSAASFAVLKTKQTPADLVVEYAIDETVRIAAIAKSKRNPVEVHRATTALKRVIDIAIAAEKRISDLAKANALGVIHPSTSPDQQKVTSGPLRGAGPLAKSEPAVEVAPVEVEVEVDPLDAAISDLSAQLGEDPEEPEAQDASAGEPEEEEETPADEDEDGGGDSNPENQVQAGAAKSYPIGADGVPIDAPVTHDVDVTKAVRREKRNQISNSERLLKAVQTGDQATIDEFKEKAKRPEGRGLTQVS